jgi:predicted aspartyl protease
MKFVKCVDTTFDSPIVPVVLKDIKSNTVKVYNALWDTGANSCAVTQKVIDDFNLQPTNKGIALGITGAMEKQNFYRIGMVFTQPVYKTEAVIEDIEVGLFRAPIPTHDVIIGMNVISQGCLKLENVNGEIHFSFTF